MTSGRRVVHQISWLLLLLAPLGALYGFTLLPGIGGGDTAEFQRVGPTLGLAHSTGYPLYSFLGWVWSLVLPFGSPAWRMNVLSMILALSALVLLVAVLRWMNLPRWCTILVPLALGTTHTFWQEATHAEIYALAIFFQVLLILLLLHWRNSRQTLPMLALVLGLALTHHRTSILLLPGIFVFLVLGRSRFLGVGRHVWLLSLGALMLPWLLYAYIPWRAAAWQNGWQILREYLFASSAGDWIDIERWRGETLSRIFTLIDQLIIEEWTLLGVFLALLGARRVWKTDRALAGMIGMGYGLVFAFCCVYYVPDLPVFFLPAQVFHAMLVGHGLAWVAEQLPVRVAPLALAPAVILIIWLIAHHRPSIVMANSEHPEILARQRLASQPALGALIIGDGFGIESLRYLQAVEGLRPDLEYGFNADPVVIRDALSAQRPVYLLQPHPELGLDQQPIGQLWQVFDRPLRAATPLQGAWEEGIELKAVTVPSGVVIPGDAVVVVLEWTSQSIPSRDYIRFVHLVGPDGTLWGQDDAPPATAPTSAWAVGESQLEVVAPRLDIDAPSGDYHIAVGWYHYPPLEPLLRADGPGETLVIGTFRVER